MNQNQAIALRASLVEMMDRIEKKEPILEQLERIGKLQAEVAPTVPEQLGHFLERRSYAKAIEYLENGFIVDDPNRPESDEEEAHP